jgi:hypothetical protein
LKQGVNGFIINYVQVNHYEKKSPIAFEFRDSEERVQLVTLTFESLLEKKKKEKGKEHLQAYLCDLRFQLSSLLD